MLNAALNHYLLDRIRLLESWSESGKYWNFSQSERQKIIRILSIRNHDKLQVGVRDVTHSAECTCLLLVESGMWAPGDQTQLAVGTQYGRH
jgi:hypothetical protein